MKNIFLFCIVQCFVFGALAQKEIRLEDVGSHVGDSVKVCGKIFSGRFLTASQNRPTFLNMGGAYPHQLLTVMINGSDRMNFDAAPEKEYVNKDVCITGKISLYKEKPQLILYRQEQIIVVE